MLTAIAIALLVLLTVAYAAAPLLGRRSLVDPLPDERDPVLVDLEEERDSLLRAIRELDGRLDLPTERRDELRARYEAKAARVLRALEAAATAAHRGAVVTDAGGARAAGHGERPAAAPATAPSATPATVPAAARPRRLPWGALTLLGAAAITTVTLGSFVLPRVGQGTVTTFFPDELRAAESLRDLIRAADRDPSVSNLMALADAYWQLADAEGAETTYRRVVAFATDDGTSAGAPPLAYKRLALLVLQRDLPAALELLREARLADPTDPETLFAIGELSFALGELDASVEGFEAYLATPEGAGDPDALARLELVRAIGPATEAVAERRDAENLLDLADVFWTAGAVDPAAELYFEVLSEFDPLAPTALSRIGQLLFTRDRPDDAIALIERAAGAAGGLVGLEPQASLFLGNAYAMLGDDQGAVRAWTAHVELVGVDAAGRVTGMLEAAHARLAGSEAPVAGAAPEGVTPGDAPPTSAEAAQASAEAAFAALSDPERLLQVGAELYRAHCAVCHGAEGQGATGVQLAGNPRAANAANTRSVIRFGRGIMPGFGALLSEAEIEVLVRWVGQELAAPR